MERNDGKDGGLHKSLQGLLQQGSNASPPDNDLRSHQEHSAELFDAVLSTATTSIRSSPHNELEELDEVAIRPRQSRSSAPEDLVDHNHVAEHDFDGRMQLVHLSEHIPDAERHGQESTGRAAKTKARRKRGRQQPQLPRVATLCIDRRLIVPRRDAFAVPDLGRSEADFFRGIFASPRTASSIKIDHLPRPSTAMGIARATATRRQGDKIRLENVDRCRNSFRRLALDLRAACLTSSLHGRQGCGGCRVQDSQLTKEVLVPDASQNAGGDSNITKVLMQPVTPTVQVCRFHTKGQVDQTMPGKRMVTRPQTAAVCQSSRMRAGDPNKFAGTCLGPGPAAYDITSLTHDASLHPDAKTTTMANTKRGSFLDPFLTRSKLVPPPGAYDHGRFASDPGSTSLAMRASKARRSPSATFPREERVCCLLSKMGPSHSHVGYDDVRITPFRKWMG